MSAFVTMDAATVCYYEGGATAHICRHSTFAYENLHCNLVRQTESSTDQPLVTVEVSYHADPGNYRVGVPNSVEIFDANANRYRKRTTEIDNLGRITAFRDFYDNTHYLTTTLQYDRYGNVTTMRGPNTTVHYTYDNFVHSYPTAVEDTFGVRSELQDYDFRFGVPLTRVDRAGSRMLYTVDGWGRTVAVLGPKEYAAQVPYTIRYTYAGREPAPSGSTHQRAVSMAMTEHYDPQHPNNSIKTYTYCDGLGRIVQTRKEAEIGGVEKLVVSGHTVVDALGRTVASCYPTEIHNDSTRFRFVTDQSAPASTVTYDILDRPLVQTAPDGSTTTFSYGFDYNNDLNKMLFKTTTTDANSHSSIELMDVEGKPWVIHPSGQQPVYFDYNPVGDNTRVYSSQPDDWERNYTYDLLGRRLTYQEGELAESLTYNGSNLASHSQSWTENNQQQTKTTTYHYNAHRLDSVSYEDALTTIYHYDQYGRVDSLYDESGVMCYTYGDMGEVTQETRIYALPFLSQPLALSTQFTYDSWGRILNITYPDNEIVNYDYDLGGQLFRFCNNGSYSYLDSVLYDRFGAKASQKYGNGLKTNYTYDSYTRRLTGITTMDGNSQVSSFAYTYDNVGNVTQVASTCPWLNSQTFSETFTYDASDQLTAAEETQSRSYRLDVTYGDWGRITDYALVRTDMTDNSTVSEACSFSYPATASDVQCSQTMFAPESQAGTSDAQFTFGINGSLRRVETHSPEHNMEHYLFNSAANFKAYSNYLTDFAYYGYNASNTRTYKLTMTNANQWVNGQPGPLRLQLQSAMLHPNAYINFNQNGEYTKHYYSGTERICSRLGDAYVPMTASADSRTWVRRLRADALFRSQIGELVSYEEPPAPAIPADRSGGTRELVSPDVEYSPVTTLTALMPTGNPDDIFYYHTNHLGSTAFVTDQNQNVTQGFLYAPFGEITTEFDASFGSDIIPKYSFNAKELDEETGMYYYEARYYKPPVFTSRDPHFERYPTFSPYTYCFNNPLKYIDPTGKDGVLIIFPNYMVNTETRLGKQPLGHAGVLLINNKTGLTKYYEYGRYPTTDGTKGKVRKVTVPNVVIDKETGKPTQESLNNVLSVISKRSGQGGKIQGVYVEGDFKIMNDYAQTKYKESNIGNQEYNKDRKSYSLLTNNCGTFAVDVLKQDSDAKKNAPWILNPTPINIGEEFQKYFPKIYYDPKTNTTTGDIYN